MNMKDTAEFFYRICKEGAALLAKAARDEDNTAWRESALKAGVLDRLGHNLIEAAEKRGITEFNKKQLLAVVLTVRCDYNREYVEIRPRYQADDAKRLEKEHELTLERIEKLVAEINAM